MSDTAVVALFLFVAVISLFEVFVGFRIASNPRPDRPPWVGWLMVVCGTGLCILAVVLAITF